MLNYIDPFTIAIMNGVYLLLLMFLMVYYSGKLWSYFINVVVLNWEYKYKERKKKVKVRIY